MNNTMVAGRPKPGKPLGIWREPKEWDIEGRWDDE